MNSRLLAFLACTAGQRELGPHNWRISRRSGRVVADPLVKSGQIQFVIEQVIQRVLAPAAPLNVRDAHVSLH